MSRKVKLLLSILVVFGIVLSINIKSYGLNEKSLEGRTDLYCISPGKNLGSARDYNYTTYGTITIKGKEASYKGKTVENENNAILAAIFCGDLVQGYGKYANYNEAQLAVYYFWGTWMSSVGNSLGVESIFNTASTAAASNKGATGMEAAFNKAKAFAEKNGDNCEATISLLYCASANVQELIQVSASTNTTQTVEAKDGYIKITGRVWIDGLTGKDNTVDGTYGNGDKNLGGIPVRLKNADGSDFDSNSNTVTGSDGTYVIYANKKQDSPVFQLFEPYESALARLYAGAYVEFEYDGITYSSINTNREGKEYSKANEDSNARRSLDDSKAYIGPGVTSLTGNVTASTRDVIGSFETYPFKSTEDYTAVKKYHISSEQTESNSPINAYGQYIYANDNWVGIYERREVIHNYWDDTHQENDYSKPIYKKDTLTGKPTTQITGYEQKTVFDRRHFCPGGDAVESKNLKCLTITDVNLGLFIREEPDMAISADISQVDITMNGQNYVYKYGIKGVPADIDAQVQFQNKNTYKYERPINPSDVSYIQNEANKNALKVNVTYKITVVNQSGTLYMLPNEIENYFDNDYTIISIYDAENHSYTYGNVIIGENYNTVIINTSNIGQIQNEQQKEFYIKYDISYSAIKELINRNATLNNVVEINAFTTFYGENTMCAGLVRACDVGKIGNKYARLDKDSTPGNSQVNYVGNEERLHVENPQDDTDIAPSFILRLGEYKILSGTIYEDLDEKNDDEERIGNGLKDNKELTVQNVKVELLKVKPDGSTESAYLYGITDKRPTDKQAITYTDESGKFSFGSSSDQLGVIEDSYIIKYTYGNDETRQEKITTINGHEINARNYKSTIITTEPVKSVIKGTNKDKWHLTQTDNTSVAVDSLAERKELDSNLKYSNFDNKESISAYTPMFNTQIEFTKNQTSDVSENGELRNGMFEREWKVFDFGIIERPREDLVIDKKISYLKITLANGQVLIDGNPYADKLDYVKAPGRGETIDTRSKSLNEIDAKLVAVEMDSELIQGSKVEMLYDITVTNNSEIDYDYEKNSNYYYYGDPQGGTQITKAVEYVVDYLDPELTFDANNEINNKSGWQRITAKEGLAGNGYIPETENEGDTLSTLKAENYIVLITDAFQNMTERQQTEKLYVSKLIGNKADEYNYENHVEIIEIYGKIARTIDSVKPDGTQVTKSYKTGSYIPSLSRTNAKTEKIDVNGQKNRLVAVNGTEFRDGIYTIHTQDDEMSKLIITPPTGGINYIIIYIISGLIGLTLIVGGIVLIKKKVLVK